MQSQYDCISDMIQIYGNSDFWKTIPAGGCLLFQMIITSPVKGQREMVQAGNSFLICFLRVSHHPHMDEAKSG